MKLETFSSLGLGTSRSASLGNRISKKEAEELFNVARNNKVQVIDTADTYGSGDAERMIRNAISGNREHFFLVTKAGFPHMHLPEILSPMNQIGKKLYQKLGCKKNFSEQYLLKSARKSLKRLHINSLDAFLLHEPNFGELKKFEDFHKGLTKIKEEGLARSIGISTNDIEALNLALQHEVVDLVQTTLPYGNSMTETVFDICKKRNIPVIVNQVLRVLPVLKKNAQFKAALKELEVNENQTIPILISFALQYKKADCVLIGSKNPIHVRDNATLIENPERLKGIHELIETIFS